MANISEISIKRPVLSTVMTIILLLFGMIGYKFLGVREFPSVDNPIISVNVTYPGANAEVIMNQITATKFRVPSVTCLATVTRRRYQKQTPTLPRSCKSVSEAASAR